jgi:signal transduction histidine kinase/CheY-like chemotaxis protein
VSNLRDISVGRKFALILVITTASALLLISAAFIAYDHLNSQRDALEHLCTLGRMVANNSTAALAFHDSKTAAEVLSSLQEEPEIQNGCTYDSLGSLLAQYHRMQGASCPPAAPRHSLAALTSAGAVYVQPVALNEAPAGYVYIESNLAQMRTRRGRFAAITLVFLIASLAAAGLLGSILRRWIATPIVDLARVMQRVSASRDYSLRAAPKSGDEIGRLVVGFNHMLGEIERSHLRLEKELQLREEMNRQLEQAKEAAESASRAKGEFLANMSHEIRTPMNGIMGMTELALETELTVEQRDYLLAVRSSSEALLSVINDVLDFSKIEAGKMELEEVVFDLDDLLGETMRSVALRAHQKGLELIYYVGPEVPAYLRGDPARLRQVAINLVGNAIKFTEHGEVLLSVSAEGTGEAAELHFEVRDTGIGIAPDKQEAIFEAFRQADSSITRQHGGTGLGLTISSRIVKMFQGKLWVESRLGEGSTFHFTACFPVAQRPPESPVPADPSSLKAMRALVVDDNATNRKVLQAMLKSWEMRPALATDAASALASLEEACQRGEPLPVILLDGRMPGMDGFQLAGEIRKRPQLSAATIMMLTSDDQLGASARCRELGITAYLVKPIRQAELLRAILQALGREVRQTVRLAAPALPAPAVRLRVLLAEDNVVNQVLATRLLEKAGHQVCLVPNGREAIQLWGAQPFDLVLMDVQMPEMDGLQATEEIRRREFSEGRSHTPVLAMTAHAMHGDRERCLNAGMDGYLTKPLRQADLLSALRSFSAAVSGPA